MLMFTIRSSRKKGMVFLRSLRLAAFSLMLHLHEPSPCCAVTPVHYDIATQASSYHGQGLVNFLLSLVPQAVTTTDFWDIADTANSAPSLTFLMKNAVLYANYQANLTYLVDKLSYMVMAAHRGKWSHDTYEQRRNRLIRTQWLSQETYVGGSMIEDQNTAVTTVLDDYVQTQQIGKLMAYSLLGSTTPPTPSLVPPLYDAVYSVIYPTPPSVVLTPPLSTLQTSLYAITAYADTIISALSQGQSFHSTLKKLSSSFDLITTTQELWPTFRTGLAPLVASNPVAAWLVTLMESAFPNVLSYLKNYQHTGTYRNPAAVQALMNSLRQMATGLCTALCRQRYDSPSLPPLTNNTYLPLAGSPSLFPGFSSPQTQPNNAPLVIQNYNPSTAHPYNFVTGPDLYLNVQQSNNDIQGNTYTANRTKYMGFIYDIFRYDGSYANGQALTPNIQEAYTYLTTVDTTKTTRSFSTFLTILCAYTQASLSFPLGGNAFHSSDPTDPATTLYDYPVSSILSDPVATTPLKENLLSFLEANSTSYSYYATTSTSTLATTFLTYYNLIPPLQRANLSAMANNLYNVLQEGYSTTGPAVITNSPVACMTSPTAVFSYANAKTSILSLLGQYAETLRSFEQDWPWLYRLCNVATPEIYTTSSYFTWNRYANVTLPHFISSSHATIAQSSTNAQANLCQGEQLRAATCFALCNFGELPPNLQNLTADSETTGILSDKALARAAKIKRYRTLYGASTPYVMGSFSPSQSSPNGYNLDFRCPILQTLFFENETISKSTYLLQEPTTFNPPHPATQLYQYPPIGTVTATGTPPKAPYVFSNPVNTSYCYTRPMVLYQCRSQLDGFLDAPFSQEAGSGN